MLKYILPVFITGVILFVAVNFRPVDKSITPQVTPLDISASVPPTPPVELVNPPQSKILENGYHVFQTFNNCGPAALSMALSYYGISVSQQLLGDELRPYQNPQGDNDDKSVTLEELGEKAKDFGLIPYHRPNGNIELIKKFITYDFPVVTRTLTKIDEDIGHYRIVKGYNDETKQIIQDDSLQNKNLWFSYENFSQLWKRFNYEYLVLIPGDKQEIAEAILGEDLDVKIAWQKALQQAQGKLAENEDDIYTRFNLSVALYEVGDYQRSVEEFEKVENQLPFRTLWYQIEPILAYYELGNYDRVFQITDRVLNKGNLAFSELYIIRGDILLKQSNSDLARQEYEKGLYYNQNLKVAKEKLNL
ncbi:hypothetical protein A2954_01055 [Candidatus Roizmanbacteria bacterium RIFCSPLOWO2_01_FULL_37_12]|uniref:Peptidase C39 domain-containing protein n=1 Tax=Candidatus Roizmanbacteria bacterium RIFCSPLOWO2_01_FULL_37_12 TaxID=1802056 RepID=A0A1F7IGD0_9BACT|nr:MAG: hypothetical protein A2954_01055 [Candidatus Roizmanbacteria bacterium RIFCSPLOWO2_01_FULL_37_12]